jgi:hypothetical protein
VSGDAVMGLTVRQIIFFACLTLLVPAEMAGTSPTKTFAPAGAFAGGATLRAES